MARFQSCGQLLSRSVFLIASRGAAHESAGFVIAAAAPAATLYVKSLHSLQSYGSSAPSLWQHHCFSSQTGGSSSNNSKDADAVVDQLNSMVEVMMQNPATQQMLLSRLPEHMRKPDVLRAMLANPEVRQRIAALAQQSGLAQMFSGLDPAKMAAGLQATSQAGLDAAKVMDRFSQSPTLTKRMQNPRVLAALMDMASHGPDALKQYSGDKEVVEAAMEAGDIIQQLQQEQAGVGPTGSSSGSSSSSSSSSSGTSMASIEAQLGMNPQDLMQRLMQRPDLLEKFQDPKVQQALQEVSQSPWKIVKYIFNKDVMSAIMEMKNMLQPPAAKR